jgi:hypothetical protein
MGMPKAKCARGGIRFQRVAFVCMLPPLPLIGKLSPENREAVANVPARRDAIADFLDRTQGSRDHEAFRAISSRDLSLCFAAKLKVK